MLEIILASMFFFIPAGLGLALYLGSRDLDDIAEL